MNDRCAICGKSDLRPLISFRDYPLTDTLCRERPPSPPPACDQALVQCEKCGHLQLARFLPPDLLYGSDYRFRTGDSAMARSGTEFFLNFLDAVAPGRKFRLAVDVGCNDLHCLNSMKGRAVHRIGIDPIWIDNDPPIEPGLTVIGSTVEAVNWNFAEGRKVDLIVCRHTLEHLSDPRSVVETFLEHLSDDGILIIEIPGAEALIEKYRFDQIFHQHLHYFTRPTMHRLLQNSGAKVISEAENWTNWGAQLTAAIKRPSSARQPECDTVQLSDEILSRHSVFRAQMSAVSEMLKISSDTTRFVGYGAGQMLPILAWHLNTTLDFLDCVLDDDAAKDGLYYANLPLAVRYPKGSDDWRDKAVLITAVDHAHSIAKRLHSEPPRFLAHSLCFL